MADDVAAMGTFIGEDRGAVTTSMMLKNMGDLVKLQKALGQDVTPAIAILGRC